MINLYIQVFSGKIPGIRIRKCHSSHAQDREAMQLMSAKHKKVMRSLLHFFIKYVLRVSIALCMQIHYKSTWQAVCILENCNCWWSPTAWRSEQDGEVGCCQTATQSEVVYFLSLTIEMQVMSHVGQGLQHVIGYCEQKVGWEEPAEAEDTVAYR